MNKYHYYFTRFQHPLFLPQFLPPSASLHIFHLHEARTRIYGGRRTGLMYKRGHHSSTVVPGFVVGALVICRRHDASDLN